MDFDPNRLRDTANDPSWWHMLPFVLTAGQSHRGSVKSVMEAVVVALIAGGVGGGVGVYATVAVLRAELTSFKEAVNAQIIKLETRDAVIEQRIYEMQRKETFR